MPRDALVPYRDCTPCRYFLSLRQKISGKVLRKSPRLSHLARQTTKISFHFFAAPPRPPAARRKGKARKFLVCAVGSVSKSSVRSLHFPNFAFSDLPSTRGAPIARACDSTNIRSHLASTSHWPLTFVRDACSVLASVRLGASFELVVIHCACPALPVRAQTPPA